MDPKQLGTDPDPVLFVSGFEDAKKSNCFCILVFKVHFTSVFEDKKS